MKRFLTSGMLFLSFSSTIVLAQDKKEAPDSVTIAAHPSYNDVSGIHRWLFGENYRAEWAIPVKLPLIRISRFQGGLKPVRAGGGMESKSLRLADPSGTEWVLRSVEKIPDKLLPPNLQGTFAVDWVGDEFSGQHPYSALIVPPLAEAAGVRHANPVIGVVADEPELAEFRKTFAGMVCLLEEREPGASSDNTLKMERELVKSFENQLDGEAFLRARLLDLLIGDWDRHEDQWRWVPLKQDKGKLYEPVPRDRDQVFHVTEGLFPSIAALPWLDPVLENFDGRIPRVRYSIYKTRFMKAYPGAQLSYERWMQITDDFIRSEADSVLEQALLRLPIESYKLRHDVLLKKLKERRGNIRAAMAEYYRFINRIVDLRLTDKNEGVTISDNAKGELRIAIDKLDKNGQVTGNLTDRIYDPRITRELRVYLQGGNDRLAVNTFHSPIKIRVIDSTGAKSFAVQQAAKKIQVYGRPDSLNFSGERSRFSTHFSADSLDKRFVPADLYNVWMPLATAGINADDGFLLGLGFRYTGHDGFRKLPYSNVQELMLTHSFATDAFRLYYSGEWIKAIGKADLTLRAVAQAPDNTMNFFGRGNETGLNKTGDYHRFYRSRFDLYQVDPALRWQLGQGNTLSTGPSLQYYHPDAAGNADRFIHQSALINSYDALIIDKDKAHAGWQLDFTANQRNNNTLPSSGFYLNINAEAYTGLNDDSRSFVQVRPEFTYYLPVGNRIVLSDRVGGGVSFGGPAFYQSMFLGGQGNLLGYLQNRFSGDHMLYNNFQTRLKLANIAGYILPGQLGLTGFYDTGRVWVRGESSDNWHNGTGGGLYFSPAGLTVVQLLAGHSVEGWYPYISFNFRL